MLLKVCFEVFITILRRDIQFISSVKICLLPSNFHLVIPLYLPHILQHNSVTLKLIFYSFLSNIMDLNF